MSFLSDYTEKNSNLIPKIDIPCFAWNSQAEQGLLFFKAKSLSQFQFCCKYADIPKNALHFRTLPFNFYQLLMYFNGLTAAPPM